ncbi:MAG: PAS domain-containing protein [Ferrovibrio sp.]|uniref:PAS domain-containing protein n=1 Tax=Ferrovibrio sp. TaxID=1917215 RepID=UPI002612283B|nr:PAS domain-containing protein [Ferrovibrio sp.]MCW0233293.1 PAS domain-containing protein [Ferrovibrio sp.]
MTGGPDAAFVHEPLTQVHGALCAPPAQVMPHIGDARLKQLLQAWDGWRGARTLPSRADFRPEELRSLLGHLFLLDIVAAETGLRFRYRLFGSAVTVYRGFDLTGRFLDQHPDPHFAARAHQAYLQAVQARQPLWANVRGATATGMSANFEGLILPLAQDGETADMVLSAQIMTQAPTVETPLAG